MKGTRAKETPPGGRKTGVLQWLCLLPASVCCLAALGACAPQGRGDLPVSASTFAMDTVISQGVYGTGAQEAAGEVNRELAAFEDRLSLYRQSSDIHRLNAAAGSTGVEVSGETARLLEKALALSAQSGGAFAITIAPVTLAWGVTSDMPRVPEQEELAALLPLVDDRAVVVNGNTVFLPEPGMGVDLGGIAKGEACALAAAIYEKNGVQGAWLSIGGNVYIHGTKPDGSRFRVGFADPAAEGDAYIASFEMENEVIAISGGYERYFEQDGERYIHIFDAATGMPPQTDIVSVGAVHQDGATADFWSTTLFIWGKAKTMEWMGAGGTAIVLDKEGTLYVSESLRESFRLNNGEYAVEYVPQAGGNA